MDIVLFGAPGSGKGTQAEQLSRQFNIPHIASGDLFRENLNNETELGKLAKEYMERGELVPDDVTVAMLKDRLARPDTKKGFLLDGFPRTLPQAEALSGMLAEEDRGLDGVIYIKVSDEEIVKRLSGRLICRECQVPFHKIYKPFESCPYDKCNGEYLYQREDDKPETVRNRLKTFHTQTAPLIDYYRDKELLVEVDGEGAVSEVTARMEEAVRDIQA